MYENYVPSWEAAVYCFFFSLTFRLRLWQTSSEIWLLCCCLESTVDRSQSSEDGCYRRRRNVMIAIFGEPLWIWDQIYGFMSHGVSYVNTEEQFFTRKKSHTSRELNRRQWRYHWFVDTFYRNNNTFYITGRTALLVEWLAWFSTIVNSISDN